MDDIGRKRQSDLHSSSTSAALSPSPRRSCISSLSSRTSALSLAASSTTLSSRRFFLLLFIFSISCIFSIVCFISSISFCILMIVWRCCHSRCNDKWRCALSSLWCKAPMSIICCSIICSLCSIICCSTQFSHEASHPELPGRVLGRATVSSSPSPTPTNSSTSRAATILCSCSFARFFHTASSLATTR